MQHLDSDAQLEHKRHTLQEALRRIGRCEPLTWLAPVRGPMWHYRRKARLGVRYVPNKGGILIGFRERRRSFVTPLTECHTLEIRLARLIPALRELISGLSVHRQIPQIEATAGENQIALVFRHLTPLTADDHRRIVEFGEARSAQVLLQPAGPASVHPLWPAEPDPLTYQISDPPVELAFGPLNFIQVNAEVNRKLVDLALKLLSLQPTDHLVDLFCGFGNFTVPAAHLSASVAGFEADASLVAAARNNAERNSVANTSFNCVDLSDPEQVKSLTLRCSKLLLDPPRIGALEIAKSLVPALRPARIVYVSCNPATLARDCGILTHVHGYRLQAVGVVDMFPHTMHGEAIAMLERTR